MSSETQLTRILKQSMLWVDVRKLTGGLWLEIWDTTTCQDALHSIYCTHSELKALECDKAYTVIQLLRPFFLKYHSKLFRNVSASGKDITTRAKRFVRLKYRKKFQSDFKTLQNAVRNTITD